MTAGQDAPGPSRAWPTTAPEAARPPDAAPSGTPPAAPPPDPTRRYRPLLSASVALIAGSLLAIVATLALNPWLVGERGNLPDPDAAVAVVGWLALAGLALTVGLAANVARSIVVRESLPPDRYRGPSLLALLALATIGANTASAAILPDVAGIVEGGSVSTRGALILLTVTQMGLVGAAALYVFAPRALAGLRLLPARGLVRSILVGLALAVPAWVGAQLVGYLVVRLLSLVGIEPQPGLIEAALESIDPVVLVVALVVVAPVAEELFFRGVVYNAWLREYGARRALWGSAALFGLIHLDLFLIVPIVALGVVLGLLYRRTGSLPAAIALHAGFNGISVTLALLIRYGVLDIPLT